MSKDDLPPYFNIDPDAALADLGQPMATAGFGQIAEACAEQDVYLVPLTGGVRIGLCAIPLAQIKRVAEALAHSLN